MKTLLMMLLVLPILLPQIQTFREVVKNHYLTNVAATLINNILMEAKKPVGRPKVPRLVCSICGKCDLTPSTFFRHVGKHWYQ